MIASICATSDDDAFFAPECTENTFAQRPVAQMAQLHLVASIAEVDVQTESEWYAAQTFPGELIAKQAVSQLPWNHVVRLLQI